MTALEARVLRLVTEWKRKGYTMELRRGYPDTYNGYTLLMHPDTQALVRIYDTGIVWFCGQGQTEYTQIDPADRNTAMPDEHNSLQAQHVSEWERKGYTEKKSFKGEYMLMIKPSTLDMVRIYEDGDVWVKNTKTGVYAKAGG